MGNLDEKINKDGRKMVKREKKKIIFQKTRKTRNTPLLCATEESNPENRPKKLLLFKTPSLRLYVTQS